MVTGAWKSEFAYDGLMRRRVRKEFTWSGSAWVQTNEVRYVYDGRLVLQERHYTPNANTLVPLNTVTYTRGNDLSGSLEGAGGIGGLLARSDSGEGGSPHSYYHADGNGNVTALVNETGTLVARYTYDPYGNMLAMSGPMAEANLYRFSSKEWHAQSGLVYYLYRYYEPNLQRWMNADPLGDIGSLALLAANAEAWADQDDDGEITEDEFLDAWRQVNRNLFAAMGNDPVNRFDAFGLCDDSLDAAARSAPKEVAEIGKETATEGRAYIKELDRLRQLAKDAKKLDVKELARRFNVSKDSFHRDMKKRILTQFRDEFKKRGLGNDPDVLIDAEGHVVLRTASGVFKEVWNTGVSALSYCK